MEYVKLHNGYEFPLLGLGTFRAREDEAQRAMEYALEVGYKAFDTAFIYSNEKTIGQTLKQQNVNREDIFLTSKLWNTVSQKTDAREAFERTCDDLGTDYLDLYLIHWPGSYQRNAAMWSVLEELYQEKRVKAIGVSNFNIHHLNSLMSQSTIKPMVNQVECHIKLQNHALQQFCNGHEIYLQAYAPLMSAQFKEITEDENLAKIGEKYGKTAAQIALKALVSRDIIALPKSSNKGRLQQNFEIFDFELTNEETFAIRKMNRGKRIFPEPDNVDFGFSAWW